MAFASLGQDRIAYNIEGSGAPLVLLHGTGGDSFSNWGTLTPALAQQFTVISIDYAGSGATECDADEFTLAHLSAQIIAVLDDAGIAQTSITGFSLGAVIAAHVAATHPARIQRLVMLAGFAGGPNSRMQLQFAHWLDLMTSTPERMARHILLTGFSPAFLERLSADDINKRQKAIVRFTNWPGMAKQTQLDAVLDIRPLLQDIKQPTLVIGCRHDQMIPVQLTQALCDDITQAQYVEINSGHLATLENPKAVLELLQTFLS
jgi:pimeloyl-ACP methyl ester carboxylesterase